MRGNTVYPHFLLRVRTTERKKNITPNADHPDDPDNDDDWNNNMWQQLRSAFTIQLARWKRRIQLRSQLAVLNWTVPDGVAGYPPLTLFDARRDGAGIIVVGVTANHPTTPINNPSSSSTTANAAAATQQQQQQDDQQDQHLESWWKAADDRAIGGFSSAIISYPRPHFIRWSGTVDTTVGLASRVHRSGYCAIHSDHDLFQIDLQGNYQAIEITARAVPRHRSFTVNLTVHSSIPEDLYQGELRFDDDDDDPDDTHHAHKDDTKHDGSGGGDSKSNGGGGVTDSKKTTSNNNASSSSSTTTKDTASTTTATSSSTSSTSTTPKSNPTTTTTTSLLSALHQELDQKPFRRFVLPFSSFRITSRGRDRHVIRRLDDRIQLERFGFLVVGTNHKNNNKPPPPPQQGDNDPITSSSSSSGPFALDIARIRAVNLYDEDDDDNSGRRWRRHYHPHQRRASTVIGDDLDDDDIVDNDVENADADTVAAANDDADQPRDDDDHHHHDEIRSKKEERPPEQEESRLRSRSP
jgi:Complex I intermediate-associated protein 30 (CIA30)